MKNKTNQIIAFALIVSMIALGGCKKDKEESAPALPPISSLAIDVSVFAGDDLKKSTMIDTCSYFHIVSGAVGYWNLSLAISLAIPVAAYAEALEQDAVRLDNDTWVWSYSLDNVYSADLVADVVGDSVLVGMYITKASVYDSVLWYSGKFDILRTGGEWTINNLPDHPTTAWLKIQWNADYKEETADIRYTVVDPANEYNNSYIEYGKKTDPDYDLYYYLYLSQEDRLYSVGYNSKTHVGYVTYDANQFCWNVNHANTDCPGID
ncbi:MAG: hypothetical protein R6X09_13445 [Bacteroidales bacterium]